MLNAQTALDVIANNLANASTTGFRRDGVAFNEGLTRMMRDQAGTGRPVGQLGLRTELQVKFTDLANGPILDTGNGLDVALRGEGMFAYQTSAGVRYGRNGAMTLNAQGQLTTLDGALILDSNRRPIGPLQGKPVINVSGEITVGSEVVATLGVFNGTFVKQADGGFDSTDATAVTTPNLVVGAVEGSNVNAVEEMIAMIKTNRIFEMAQRSVLGHEQMTEKLIQALENR